jgi:hypothetical protein
MKKNICIVHGPVVGVLVQIHTHLFLNVFDVQVVEMLRDSDSGVQAQALLTLSKQGWKQKMDGMWSHTIFVSCQANEVLDIAIELCGNSLIQSRTPLSQRLQQGKHRK